QQAQLDKIDELRSQIAAAETDGEKDALNIELDKARRDLGRAGRWQAPLLSLPFQMHAFAMSAGAKTLYGLFSSQERGRVGGFLSLLLAGATVTYLKAHDPIGGLTTSSEKQRKQAYAWNKMTWGEFLWSTFEQSNLGAIFTDVAKNVTSISRKAGFGDPSGG